MAPGRNAFSWHKVTLKNGAKYDKIFMLKELVQRSSVKFVPICYLTNNNNNNATFFVEEQEAGRAIKVTAEKYKILFLCVSNAGDAYIIESRFSTIQ